MDLKIDEAGDPLWSPNIDRVCGSDPDETSRLAFAK